MVINSNLLAVFALVGALGVLGAEAHAGPPPLPPSVLSDLTVQADAQEKTSKTDRAASEPQEEGGVEASNSASPAVPVIAADDPLSRLAAEVPIEVIDREFRADKTWLSQEVGPIGTRPVAETNAPMNANAPVTAPADDGHGLRSAANQEEDNVSPAPATPSIVKIMSDFSNAGSNSNETDAIEDGADKESTPAQPAKLAAPLVTTSIGRFAMLWIDGYNGNGDATFVRFYRPSRVWFEDGRSCLKWARNEVAAGRVPAPNGIQAYDLSAVCFGVAADVDDELWIWRRRSGAFTRSVLMPDQARLFRAVMARWTVTGPAAKVGPAAQAE